MCIKCGSPVTDSLDSEIEEQGQLKSGKYVNSLDMQRLRSYVNPSGRFFSFRWLHFFIKNYEISIDIQIENI